MKNKLYIMFALLISVFIINVAQAESLLTYEDTYEYSEIENYQGMISLKNKIYILDSSSYSGATIINPNSDFTDRITKTLPDLSNPTIIKYNDSILLVGLEMNALKLYLLDENLQVISQKDSSYIVNQDAIIKAYSYDNKVYLMLFENDILLNTTIYEIDSNLNIKENSLSSYDSTLLKKALKGDYYLIRMNDSVENNRVTHYYDTSYTKDYYFLVGNTFNTAYDETTGYDYKAKLTIIDSSGNIISNIENQDYYSYQSVEFIKNKIVILAKNDSKESLLIYDKSGKLEETIDLSTRYKENRMINQTIVKLNNQLIVYASELVRIRFPYNTFTFYSFDLSIISNESPYGTTDVVETALPNEEVTIKTTPNKGYEVDTIEVIDSLGNVIPVTNNKFIMPEDDVYITINYKASVINPETTDLIILVSILTILGIGILLVSFKRLRWLK